MKSTMTSRLNLITLLLSTTILLSACSTVKTVPVAKVVIPEIPQMQKAQKELLDCNFINQMQSFLAGSVDKLQDCKQN